MIYFVTAPDLGRVKIGFSCDPVSRFMKIRGDSPATVTLERVMHGDRGAEAELHDRFAEQRLHGEWFAITGEVAAFMASLPKGPHISPPIQKRRRQAFDPEQRRQNMARAA